MEIPQSAQSIAEKLALDEHSVELIDTLQEYLNEQVQTDTYDFMANKTLMKLYQFYPERSNENCIALAVTKSMMALPSTDLSVLLYLVPETLALKEPIHTLVRCADHLETARFVEFWEVANLGGNELLDAIPGFPEAIRSFMIGVLSMTFQKLQSETFLDLLMLDEESLEEFIAEQTDKLCLEEKKFVIFLPNSENQSRPKKFKENISFDHMLPIINLLSRNT